MSQDILKISQDAFEIQIAVMSDKKLVNLIVDIYDFKGSQGWKLNEEQIIDLERKETKVYKVLMERGYLGKKEFEQFIMWIKQLGYKKKKKVF